VARVMRWSAIPGPFSLAITARREPPVGLHTQRPRRTSRLDCCDWAAVFADILSSVHFHL